MFKIFKEISFIQTKFAKVLMQKYDGKIVPLPHEGKETQCFFLMKQNKDCVLYGPGWGPEKIRRGCGFVVGGRGRSGS